MKTLQRLIINEVNFVCSTLCQLIGEDRAKDRLADRRVQQAAATKAETLAVACPYEPSRFEDAVKITGYEGKMIVRDIIELLAESMGPE